MHEGPGDRAARGKILVQFNGASNDSAIKALKTFEYLSSPACNKIKSIFIHLFQKVRVTQNITQKSDKLLSFCMF